MYPYGGDKFVLFPIKDCQTCHCGRLFQHLLDFVEENRFLYIVRKVKQRNDEALLFLGLNNSELPLKSSSTTQMLSMWLFMICFE